jgi:transcriptional regulator with XRE-family HTH domain
LIYQIIVTNIAIKYCEDKIMSDIGHGIKVRRVMLKLNQSELARAIGIKQAYMSQLENGERPLSDELLQKIAVALRCKPEDLTRWQQAA